MIISQGSKKERVQIGEKLNPKLNQKYCCQNGQNRTTNWGLINPVGVGKRGTSVNYQGKRAGGRKMREGCVKLEKKK